MKQKPVIHNKRRNRIRLHDEGKYTLLVTGFILAVTLWAGFYLLDHNIGPDWMSWLYYGVMALAVVVYLILLNFFRCPVRMFQGPTTKSVVAPADGHIVVIEEVEETDYFHDRRIMVSIFMSLTNVHANWIPCEGTVIKVDHQDGNFHKAYLPKASEENERSMVVIRTPHGVDIMARCEGQTYCDVFGGGSGVFYR